MTSTSPGWPGEPLITGLARCTTLRGIDPPDPYRILIKIPGGMEYTNEPGEADVASAKRIQSTGEIKFELENGHSSLAYVRHGNKVETAEYHPTVVTG